MYWWKCWRDARLAVAVYLVPMVLYAASVIHHPGSSGVNQPSARNFSSEAVSMQVLQVIGVLLPLIAWVLGGFGIGHEIAQETGPYFLSRPRPRRFFCLADATCAFALLAVLVASALVEFAILAKLRLTWLPQSSLPSPLLFLAAALTALVFAGLIYAVAYLCTAAVPSEKGGRVASVAVLFAYAWLHIRSHHWQGISTILFPDWWISPYPNFQSASLASHYWLHIGERAVWIVVLLLIAQMVLERREVRA